MEQIIMKGFQNNEHLMIRKYMQSKQQQQKEPHIHTLTHIFKYK